MATLLYSTSQHHCKIMAFQSRISVEESVCTLQAMRKQEDDFYSCEGSAYFHSHQLSFLSSPEAAAPVDESCRSKMIEWCYQIVDFCKFSRETGAIAINYLDRYTHSSLETRDNRGLFQLACMTCLYTAIKIHEPQAMEPKAVSSLSRGIFSAQEVIDMERKILAALKWRVHPPTALAFLRHYLLVVPENIISSSERSVIIELCKFQTELAVKDCLFLGSKPSTIALVALRNALEFTSPPCSSMNSILDTIIRYADIRSNDIERTYVKSRLFRCLETNTFSVSPGCVSQRTVQLCKQQTSKGLLGSPRSVSASTTHA